MDRSGTLTNASSLKVCFRKIPESWRSWDIYQIFCSHGNISHIELFQMHQQRYLEGYVIFCPPPKNAQWASRSITVIEQGHQKRQVKCSAIIHKPKSVALDSTKWKQELPEVVRLSASQLDIGVMVQEDKMLSLFTAKTSAAVPLELEANTRFNELVITFGAQTRMPLSGEDLRTTDSSFKVCIPFAQIRRICTLQNAASDLDLIFDLDMPPLLWQKTNDIKATHHCERSKLKWNESQIWFRQTGIDSHPRRSEATTQLQMDYPVLDAGRWLAYHLVIEKAVAESPGFHKTMKILAKHNILTSHTTPITLAFGKRGEMWAWAESPTSTGNTICHSSLSELQKTVSPASNLSFGVRYQLEVCLSQGFLHECNIHTQFIDKLAAMDSGMAVKLLEKVVDDQIRLYNPMEVFRLQSQTSIKIKKPPRYCATVATAIITPTTIYFTTPMLEISNRVVREYRQHEDRFLRVKFSDERYKGKVMSGHKGTMGEVFARIKDTMKNGIKIGDRHYEFLAFGNSQMREHGAYFFASSGAVTAAEIRRWMGDFACINVVSKYAARLGQCLSATRAMPIAVKVEPISDIERNGFCFTDGVGKISPFLAKMIAEELGFPEFAYDYPSAFQFRLGGFKGVLAVDPTIKGRVIRIRPSQKKFTARYHGLEICRAAQYSPAYLNVQIILVLETLGVPSDVFVRKMQNTLADVHAVLGSEENALEQLCKNIDNNGTTSTLASMISDGFMCRQDSFLISCLRLWRAWMVKYLKEKWKIFVEQGALVMGCIDETATLRGHFDSAPQRSGTPRELSSLPEIFLQIPDPAARSKFRVVQSTCILARNPCLHPGDVRVVRAIDVPDLHHLKNCVVLPQTGDRDLANMCSGGDLDGDDYLVIWDPELIPEEWNHAPMDYEGPEPIRSSGSISVDPIISFFVSYMENDNLGRIATAHKFWADFMDDGVKSRQCLELARLHSLAVDYAKTGNPAAFPEQLRFESPYPHWSERSKTYCSHKAIGKIFDIVERIVFYPAWDLPFDRRVLEAYKLTNQILRDALEVKRHYDEAMRRLMSHYEISDEFQVWTTFVMGHNQENDHKFSQDFGEKVAAMKQYAQELCYEKACTSAKEPDWKKMDPFIAAMYRVTANEVSAAQKAHSEAEPMSGQLAQAGGTRYNDMPFISFPWIFAKQLGRIAKQCVHSSQTSSLHATRTKTNLELLRDEFELEPLQDVSIKKDMVHGSDNHSNRHKNEEQSNPQVVTHEKCSNKGSTEQVQMGAAVQNATTPLITLSHSRLKSQEAISSSCDQIRNIIALYDVHASKRKARLSKTKSWALADTPEPGVERYDGEGETIDVVNGIEEHSSLDALERLVGA